MSLACGFVDISPGLRDPVVLQVSPVTTYRVAMNGANVVVSSHHRAGETFQNDAESSFRDVEGAGLKPDTIRVRNPETVIVEVGVSNEMFAVPPIRLQAIGETVESSDRHVSIEPGIGCGVNVFCFFNRGLRGLTRIRRTEANQGNEDCRSLER